MMSHLWIPFCFDILKRIRAENERQIKFLTQWIFNFSYFILTVDNNEYKNRSILTLLRKNKQETRLFVDMIAALTDRILLVPQYPTNQD